MKKSILFLFVVFLLIGIITGIFMVKADNENNNSNRSSDSVINASNNSDDEEDDEDNPNLISANDNQDENETEVEVQDNGTTRHLKVHEGQDIEKIKKAIKESRLIEAKKEQEAQT
jgi:uncharacterized membrane protein